MLSLAIFLPAAVAFVILLLPSSRPAGIRWTALLGVLATLALTLTLGFQYDAAGPAFQFETRAEWIPAIGAAYIVALDGLSLPFAVMTAIVMTAVMIYVLRRYERAKSHAFFFLLLTTGLLGVFAAQDLLLFYVFFEIALVPMYFIIGIWGHENRRYAAMKFFLYTRAGSLAMLLSFLVLSLATEPGTFSLQEIAASRPLAGSGVKGALVMLGMLIGFGVKLPTVPFHNWLPDAHVEAPTEGSVVLAALQLKMGAYGFLRIMLGTVPDAVREYGWLLAALAVISLVYGALAALGQSDLKRLVAYTSVNHMGYVLLGTAVWALSNDPLVRQLAVTGAAFQVVSHAFLTGAMFLMVGMLQDQAGTRAIDRFGGLMTRAPVFSVILGALAFGSLGLPGFSGFVAEFQVLGASISASLWLGIAVVLGLVVTTALYLRLVMGVLMGRVPADMQSLEDPPAAKLATAGGLLVLSFFLGVVPHVLIRLLAGSAAAIALLP